MNEVKQIEMRNKEMNRTEQNNMKQKRLEATQKQLRQNKTIHKEKVREEGKEGNRPGLHSEFLANGDDPRVDTVCTRRTTNISHCEGLATSVG